MERKKRKGRDRDGKPGERGEVWVGRKAGDWEEKVEKVSGERQGERGRSEKGRENWRVRKVCEEGRERRGGKRWGE